MRRGVADAGGRARAATTPRPRRSRRETREGRGGDVVGEEGGREGGKRGGGNGKRLRRQSLAACY